MLSPVREKKLTHLFNILDWNKNKSLQPDDFVNVADKISDILKFDQNSKERQAVKSKSYRLFIQLLTDFGKEEESITLDEWIELFGSQKVEDVTSIRKYIYRWASYFFSLFDQDTNNTISEQEYQDMFKVYNLDASDSSIGFAKLDINGDKEISKEEMVSAFTEYFFSSDPDAPGNWIFGNWEGA